MTKRQFKLEPEDLKKMAQIDESIQQWSVEHAKMTLNLRRLESGLDSFFEARRQIANERMKAAGIDPNRVMQLNVLDEEGNCVVSMADGPPQGDAPGAPEPPPGS